MDDVKEMNIICTYSKCVTERDGQKMDKVVFKIYSVFQRLYYIPTIFVDYIFTIWSRPKPLFVVFVVAHPSKSHDAKL